MYHLTLGVLWLVATCTISIRSNLGSDSMNFPLVNRCLCLCVCVCVGGWVCVCVCVCVWVGETPTNAGDPV